MKNFGFFDCSSGVSGDMILGALVDAGLPFKTLQKDLSQLKLKKVRVECRTVKRGDLCGIKIQVHPAPGSQRYKSLKEIQTLLNASRLSPTVIQKSLSVFRRLARAEARVHRRTVSRTHFHEIGEADTLIDVVGAVSGFERLKLEKIFFSPINTGFGKTKKRPSSTGIFRGAFLSAPAPATAELLKGIPCFSSRTSLELATPTGVALLTALGTPIACLPTVSITSVGYGAGDLNPTSHPNLLRLFIVQKQRKEEPQEEKLSLLQTNIDDLNPQIYEYLMDRLFNAGALDVYLTPVIMKKGRPSTLLSILCEIPQVSPLLEIVFHETTTLGVRIQEVSRVKLKRKKGLLQTPLGRVLGKKVFKGRGKTLIAPEYEACKKIARKTGLPLRDIMAMAYAKNMEEAIE